MLYKNIFSLKINDTFIPRIDDPNQSVCLFEIIPPIGAQTPLTADVPQIQSKPLELDRLYVEAWKIVGVIK